METIWVLTPFREWSMMTLTFKEETSFFSDRVHVVDSWALCWFQPETTAFATFLIVPITSGENCQSKVPSYKLDKKDCKESATRYLLFMVIKYYYPIVCLFFVLFKIVFKSKAKPAWSTAWVLVGLSSLLLVLISVCIQVLVACRNWVGQRLKSLYSSMAKQVKN